MARRKNRLDDPHLALILKFVSAYLTAYARSPTYREIADALELTSLDHVLRDLNTLVEIGALQKTDAKQRSLRVLDPAPAVLKPAPDEPAPLPGEPHRPGYCQLCTIKCDGPLCYDCMIGAPLIDAPIMEHRYTVEKRDHHARPKKTKRRRAPARRP